MTEKQLAALGTPLSASAAGEQIRQMNQLLVSWYRQAARDLPWRRTRDPYAIWLSEIMLQQTRVETVIPYYYRFLEALPNVAALAEAEEALLHKLWEGLGYYSRVRNLQKAAKQVMTLYGGQIPTTCDQLLNLCGIGDYTAGAVASIAFGEAVPAVDGNVLRVVSRQLAAEGDILSPAVRRSCRQLLLEQMPADCPGELNQALMDLGATICLPNGFPKCESCPISGLCLARERGQQQLFPVKSPKKARESKPYTVLVIQDEQGRFLLRQRPDTGLLASLWEFPMLEGHLTRAELTDTLTKQDIQPARIQTLRKARHIFTHLEWEMTGYFLSCPQVKPRDGEVLATWEQIQQQYAMSSALDSYRQFIKQQGEDET